MSSEVQQPEGDPMFVPPEFRQQTEERVVEAETPVLSVFLAEYGAEWCTQNPIVVVVAETVDSAVDQILERYKQSTPNRWVLRQIDTSVPNIVEVGK